MGFSMKVNESLFENINVIVQTSEKSNNKNGLFSSESKFESNQGRLCLFCGDEMHLCQFCIWSLTT